MHVVVIKKKAIVKLERTFNNELYGNFSVLRDVWSIKCTFTDSLSYYYVYTVCNSINGMAAGSVIDFSSFIYFSNILCAVKLRVLGLKTYWYTGSAFHQIPQIKSYS